MGESFNENYNALALLFLFLVIGANVWLVIKGIYTGLIYLSLFSGSIISITVLYLFIKEEQFLNIVSKAMKSPFETSLYLACFLYLLGWSSRIILQIVLSVIGGNLNSYSIPLFGSDLLSGVSQSFSIAEIESSNSWKIFNIVVNAGTSEEFVFVFIIPILALTLIALIFYGLYGKERTVSIMGRYKYLLLLSAIFISVLIFIGLHSLNQTYDTVGEYVKAGIFRGLSMITTLFFGLLFMFWVGFHQAHNAIWLITDPVFGIGFAGFFNGLFKGVGLILVGVMAFAIAVVGFGWNKVNIRDIFRRS